MIRPCNIEADLPSIKLIIKGICVIILFCFIVSNTVYFIIKFLIENFINYPTKNVNRRFWRPYFEMIKSVLS